MADKWIYIVVAILMGIGAVFSYSLPVFIELKYGYSEYHFFIRFIIFSLLGLLIMYFLSQCNPKKCFKPIGGTLFVVGFLVIFLMATPVLSPFCPTIKGAKRWIDLGFARISPIEFFKIGLIYFFSWGFSVKLVSKHSRTFKEELKDLTIFLVVLGITAFFVIFNQSDLGETLLIFIIFFIMLIFTQVSLKTFRILIVIGIGIATLGLLLKSYRVGRLKDFLYNLYYMLPDSVKNHLNWDFTTSNISYQLRQSMNAIHNGGVWGTGIGNGQIKMGFLSDVHTDFILAGIAEETGFMGVFLVICLLSFLVLRILRIAINIETQTERDYQYKLFAVGIAILISLETILNSLGIIGLLPLKGLPVPFVSYGGSSIIGFSIGVGMVLMISKKVKIGDKD